MAVILEPYIPSSGDTLDVTAFNSSMAVKTSALNAFPVENLVGAMNQSGQDFVNLGIFATRGNFKWQADHLIHSGMSGVFSKYKSGLAYLDGKKLEKAADAILMSAAKWNYVYIQPDGTVDKVVVANGSSQPSLPSASSLWLYAVQMSGASLKEYYNLAPKSYGAVGGKPYFWRNRPNHPTYRKNVNVKWTNDTTVTVAGAEAAPAELVITDLDGKNPVHCMNTANATATTTTLDTGSIAADTRYYVYAYPVTTVAGAQEFDIIISLDASAPKNFPWARKIGYVNSNNSSEFEEFYSADEGNRIDFGGEIKLVLGATGSQRVMATNDWTSYVVKDVNSGRVISEDATHIILHTRVGGAGTLRVRGLGIAASGIAMIGGTATDRFMIFALPIGFSGSDPVLQFYEQAGSPSGSFDLIGVLRPGG